MKYSIIYSSKTGNTEQLANQIKETLPKEDCIYFGKPDALANDADIIFVGSWVDKGSCTDEIKTVLEQLKNKKIFIFGTCGFGESEAYFEQLIARITHLINPSCQVVGSFMCQGKMPIAVRERYATMFPTDPVKTKTFIENFDRALTHPDENDLKKLSSAVLSIIDK